MCFIRAPHQGQRSPSDLEHVGATEPLSEADDAIKTVAQRWQGGKRKRGGHISQTVHVWNMLTTTPFHPFSITHISQALHVFMEHMPAIACLH